MRIVNICGYDSTICETYPVVIDEKGNIEDPVLKCTNNNCEHCGFMGSPWVRTELIYEGR